MKDLFKSTRPTTYMLALPLLALFAIPGSASQSTNVTPHQRLAAMQAELGFRLDTDIEPKLTIDLPERYVPEPVALALTFS